jgi:hypothetical protein
MLSPTRNYLSPAEGVVAIFEVAMLDVWASEDRRWEVDIALIYWPLSGVPPCRFSETDAYRAAGLRIPLCA